MVRNNALRACMVTVTASYVREFLNAWGTDAHSAMAITGHMGNGALASSTTAICSAEFDSYAMTGPLLECHVSRRSQSAWPGGSGDTAERIYLDESRSHVDTATAAYADERIYRWLLARV